VLSTDLLFSIQSDSDFEKAAIEVFHFQKENCKIYGDYVRLLNKENPSSIKEIPFLPIQFFKSHEVLSKKKTGNETLFLSSGTGLDGRSKHFVSDISVYEKSFSKEFQYPQKSQFVPGNKFSIL
jgi:hypothetical protein